MSGHYSPEILLKLNAKNTKDGRLNGMKIKKYEEVKSKKE
jgi:hypothetical protein